MATPQTEARIVLSAVDNTSRAFATARQGLSGLGSAIMSVQGALAGVGFTAATAYLTKIVGEARKAIDGFNDLSDATGSSIENISALDSIARSTGGNFDQVSGILVKFNQVLAEADPNKGAGAVLKALNLDIDQLKKLDPAEALRQTAVALSGFSDDANKARAVQELFGKSVREAAPFLKDLAEKNKLVGTLSSEAADEVDRFNKQLALIKANSEDVERALSINIITQLNLLIERYKVGQKEGKAFWEIAWSGYKRDVKDFWGVKPEDQRDVIMRQLREAEDGLNYRSIYDDRSAAGNAAFQKTVEERQRRINSLRARLAALDDANNPANQSSAETARLSRQNDGVVPKPILDVVETPKGPKGPKDAPFTGLTYDEQIKQRVGRLFEDSDVVKAQEYADTLARLDDLYFSGAIGQQLYDAATKQLNGSTAAGADETSKFVKEQKRLSDLLSQTESAGLEEQRQDMELLSKALQAGVISEKQYLEAVTARLNLVGQKTKEAKSFAEEFGLTFSSAMEDAIVKGGSFSDVLQGIAQDLARIVLRKSVTEPLGDALSKLDFGKLFSSIFPSAQGNVFSGAPALSAYSNTVVSQPTVFPFAKGIGLMGEAGAEAIMPLTRLANGDLGVGVKGGGGVDRITIRLVNESGTPLQATSQRQGTAEDGSRLIEVILAAAGDAVANRSGPLARGLEVGYGLK